MGLFSFPPSFRKTQRKNAVKPGKCSTRSLSVHRGSIFWTLVLQHVHGRVHPEVVFTSVTRNASYLFVQAFPLLQTVLLQRNLSTGVPGTQVLLFKLQLVLFKETQMLLRYFCFRSDLPVCSSSTSTSFDREKKKNTGERLRSFA